MVTDEPIANATDWDVFLPPEETPPTLLWHYTSRRAALEIVRKKQVWATDIRYLNDTKEFAHAIEVVRPLLDEVDSKTSDTKEKSVLSTLRGSLDDLQNIGHVFVFSLSEVEDDLNQWRGYCPNGGCAIGFGSRTFQRIHTGQEHISLHQCIYDASEFRDKMRKTLRQVIERYRALKLEEGGERRAQFASTMPFRIMLRLWAAVLKNVAFKSEREWRLVCHTDVGSGEFLIRADRDVFTPYIEMQFSQKSEDLGIDKICIGPSSDASLERTALESFLRSRYGNRIDITSSTVPYRTW